MTKKKTRVLTDIKSPSIARKLVKTKLPERVKRPLKVALEEPKPLAINVPKITRAGCYDGIPDEVYHGNCCDSPSLSNSMARMLVEECPKKMWSNSYLDPNRERKENKNFDMGHALHKIFLEPDQFEKSILEIPFMDYKTDRAKFLKTCAYRDGKIPLLSRTLKIVYRMREALLADPTAKKAFIRDGISERSYFVKDKETGVWLKARADRCIFNPKILVDYKTTVSANPDDFDKSIWNYGYYIQEPWYKYVIKEATGEEFDEWYFIAQEKEYPYLVSTIEIKPEAIEYGQKIMRQAIRKFADCLDKGYWHGYRDRNRPDQDGVITLDLPTHAYFNLAEREERGEF